MKISLNWVSDFITLPQKYQIKDKPLNKIEELAKEIAEKITMSICEVDDWEIWGRSLSYLKTAKIKAVADHPNSDKLHLVTITAGEEITLVCGAPNVREGMIVVYAPTGTVLENGLEIKPTTIRGVESTGMLCSAKEIGLSDEDDTILELPSATEIGQSLDTLFPDHKDIVFDIDNKSITHRADLWGHYGFAREFAILFKDSELKPIVARPVDLVKADKIEKPIQVAANCKDTVQRYSAFVIDNIKVKPSPAKEQQRLYRVGLRAINNIVDMTNYIMTEIGQPMHAFDADTITQQGLSIRMAKQGETLDTLAGKDASLTPQDMVICNDDKVLVVAGIVGGKESGVHESTTKIIVEAATWAGATIRRTSSRIGIRTDSSQRFEKTLDPSTTLLALQRSLSFLEGTHEEVDYTDLMDYYPSPLQEKEIILQVQDVYKRLGIAENQLHINTIETNLKKLGFQVRIVDKEIKLIVPSWRQQKDITIKEDIIEELGRIYGYNEIVAIPPKLSIVPSNMNKSYQIQRTVQDTLVAQGYNELYSHPLIAENQVHKKETSWKLINPVSQDQSYLRDNLANQFCNRIVSLQKNELNLQVFEIGRIYSTSQDGNPIEQDHAYIAITREKQKESNNESFYTLKNHINRVLSVLQLPQAKWERKIPQNKWQHKNIYAEIIIANQKIGTIFALSPSYSNSLSIRTEAYFAEIAIHTLEAIEKKQYQAVEENRFPVVRFEISIEAPIRTDYSVLENLIYGYEKRVFKVKCLSVYSLNIEIKSISIEILFQDQNGTISADDAKKLQDGVVAYLASYGYSLKQ